MAIFSRQSNNEETSATTEVTAAQAQPTVQLDVPGSRHLVVPRLSEKAGALNRLNKYVFTIFGKMNKVELRKAVEKQYGVNIAQVNMVTMQGKTRRYGRTTGRTRSFKKAVVTLKPNSKKIDLVEPNK